MSHNFKASGHTQKILGTIKFCRKIIKFQLKYYSYVMQRFEEVENFDVEGVDNKNACYGGTQALMNTINWVESSSWDGRLGIVICAGKKGVFKDHNCSFK